VALELLETVQEIEADLYKNMTLQGNVRANFKPEGDLGDRLHHQKANRDKQCTSCTHLHDLEWKHAKLVVDTDPSSDIVMMTMTQYKQT
jgi:hypothetical protein